MPENKAICWDLDGTLGRFESVYSKFEPDNEKLKEAAKEHPLALRAGIKGLLTDLSQAGYIHFLTSSAVFDGVHAAIEQTGLIGHFREIFAQETIHAPLKTKSDNKAFNGKFYRYAAESMGYSDEEAVKKMIIIGDAPGDISRDIAGLVFLEHPGILNHDVIITRMILQLLQERGQGNFQTGFQQLYERPDRINYEGQTNEERFAILSNGVKLFLGYRREVETYRKPSPHAPTDLYQFDRRVSMPFVFVEEVPESLNRPVELI